MIDNITSKTFNEGELFNVYYEEDKFIEFKLSKIRIGKYKIPGIDREPFALIFTSSKEIQLNQNTYKMVNNRVGEFFIFIVPIIPLPGEHDQYYYEAVFS